MLRKLTASAADFLRYGVAIFGGLAPDRQTAFSFQCPGPCGTLHRIRPGQHDRRFNPRTQQFRCPVCAIELQLSILAEVLPSRLTKPAAKAYEARRLREVANRPSDTVPTTEQAANLRTYQNPVSAEDSSERC